MCIIPYKSAYLYQVWWLQWWLHFPVSGKYVYIASGAIFQERVNHREGKILGGNSLRGNSLEGNLPGLNLICGAGGGQFSGGTEFTVSKKK